MKSARPAPVTLIVSLVSLSLSGCLSGPFIHLSGRLAFPDAEPCRPPLSEAQAEDWEACHRFKRNFQPSTGSYFVDPATGTPSRRLLPTQLHPEALRPLQGRLTLHVIRGDGSRQECGALTVPTTADGTYDAFVPSCGEGVPVLVRGELSLEAQVRTSNGDGPGTIRAVWDAASVATVAQVGVSSEVGVATGLGQSFQTTDSAGTRQTLSIPLLQFEKRPLVQAADAAFPTVPVAQLGTHVFGISANQDAFGYVKAVLSAYASLVEVQQRFAGFYSQNLGQSTASDSSTRYFQAMFPDHAVSSWKRTYLVSFTADLPSGGRGGMNLLRPNLNRYLSEGSNLYSRTIADSRAVQHEFGHSVHAALAPNSFGHVDYRFANPMERPTNINTGASSSAIYDFGHSGLQYQEMGTAFTEGFASGLGQFLFNECRAWNPMKRVSGGVARGLFNANQWAADFSCDRDGNDCNAHHVRYQLKQTQGLAEGSSRYNSRVAGLQALTSQGTSLNQSGILSNSESRYAEYFCDLLDSDSDTSFSQPSGMRYIQDFTAEAARILGGLPRSYANPRTYVGNPEPETIQISVVGLLETLNSLCPGATCDFRSVPNIAAAVRNGTYRDYVTRRISVEGSPLSPQNLGRKLIERRLVRDTHELNNLLKSLWMEELL